MIIISTQSGREFTIKENTFCENALELITLIQDNPDLPKLRMIQSTDGTYILTKCIVAAKDVQID